MKGFMCLQGILDFYLAEQKVLAGIFNHSANPFKEIQPVRLHL